MTDIRPNVAAIARVRGIVRGSEIDRVADVSLDDAILVLSWTELTSLRLALDALDGIASQSSQLTLYLSSGDVLELSGDDGLRPLAVRLMARACTMPELTRGLRSFGSLRGAPGAAHDLWFEPLLSVRRAVEGVTDATRQLALIDAGALATKMEGVMLQLATAKAPGDAARQRAIEAALEEESIDLFLALGRLALAADALSGSALDTRLVDWRGWILALRDVFSAADDAWRRVSHEV